MTGAGLCAPAAFLLMFFNDDYMICNIDSRRSDSMAAVSDTRHPSMGDHMRAPEAKGMTSDTEDDAAKPETKFRPRPTFRSTPAKRGTTIVLPTDVSPSIWSSPPSTPEESP
mmetsp:Transcript_6172/g.9443  ORF Transcript_6172/g.9443 Transcript_6172/m.9443 type:complete len:112 (+) Transcript_6172:2251-2586(+)